MKLKWSFSVVDGHGTVDSPEEDVTSRYIGGRDILDYQTNPSSTSGPTQPEHMEILPLLCHSCCPTKLWRCYL